MQLIKTLREKININEPVFIIGGGKSLLDTIPDKSILDGKQIITTNDAYMLYPEALLACFGDLRWFQRHKQSLNELRIGKNLPVSTVWEIKRDYINTGVFVFNKNADKKQGLSLDEDCISGTNTGHHAINIAVLLGIRNIILCGFDMNTPTDQSDTHWHSNHPWKSDTSRYSSVMIPQMEKLARDLLTTNSKVYNINKNSAIRCFEFTDIKDWI